MNYHLKHTLKALGIGMTVVMLILIVCGVVLRNAQEYNSTERPEDSGVPPIAWALSFQQESIDDYGAEGFSVPVTITNTSDRTFDRLWVRMVCTDKSGVNLAYEDNVIRDGLAPGQHKRLKFFFSNIRLKQVGGFYFKWPD